ncbi:MAG: hypothetical protein AB1758_02715 [Candidatus Eremiobacterota bacterium]
MRPRLLTCLMFLTLCTGLAAQPPEDPARVEELVSDLQRYAGEQYCRAEVLVLRKMVHLRIPADCWPRMLQPDSNDGGGRRMRYLTGSILEFFDSLGYKGLSDQAYNGQMTAVEQALNELAPRFSFTYVYEGPNEDAAWHQGIQAMGYIEGLLGRYGYWIPRSGACHITLTVTPKVKSPSCTSQDGTTFLVTAPALVEPTADAWDRVRAVFDRWKR